MANKADHAQDYVIVRLPLVDTPEFIQKVENDFSKFAPIGFPDEMQTQYGYDKKWSSLARKEAIMLLVPKEHDTEELAALVQKEYAGRIERPKLLSFSAPEINSVTWANNLEDNLKEGPRRRTYLLYDEEGDYTGVRFAEQFGSIGALKVLVLDKGNKIGIGYLLKDDAVELADIVESARIDNIMEGMLVRQNGKAAFTPILAPKRKRPGRNSNEGVPDGSYPLSDEVFLAYWGKTDGRRVEKVTFTTEYKGIPVTFEYYTSRPLVLVHADFPDVTSSAKVPFHNFGLVPSIIYKDRKLAR